MRIWAKDHGVDVAGSWAYSDSVYDLPLLSAVRHPVAVNPDPRLADHRPRCGAGRSSSSTCPPACPKVAGIEPQRVIQAFARPQMFPWVRFDIDGLEHIPTTGPAILVGNHRSYFDGLAIGYAAAQIGRPMRFLGKKEVFDAPVVGQLASALGGIRVERGTGSDEPLAAAAEALDGGELVALMPQGTIPRGRAFFEPVLVGRWGAARLAALTKAPVIPVGLWGTEQVWPRNAKLPNLLAVGHPPTVRIRVGRPVELKYRSADADTKRIMEAIVDLLPAKARERHEPTPEELARTLPSSYKGDPDAVEQHRPGSG